MVQNFLVMPQGALQQLNRLPGRKAVIQSDINHLPDRFIRFKAAQPFNSDAAVGHHGDGSIKTTDSCGHQVEGRHDPSGKPQINPVSLLKWGVDL